MLKLKRWIPTEYPVGGEVIRFKVKRLRNEEASPLMLALAQAFAVMATVTPETPSREAAILVAQFYSSLPHDRVRVAFCDYVKDVEGLEDEDGPVTEGEGLYDFADDQLVLFVLSTLKKNSVLSDKEGNASASRSTSASVPATAAGASDATDTSSEAGTKPSTVPEIVAET